MSTVQGIDTAELAEFVWLKTEKDEIQKRLEKIETEMRRKQAYLIDNFTNQPDPVTSMTVGGQTVYLSRQMFAGPKDGNTLAMVEAIKRVQPEIVKENVNYQTLCSFVREITNDGENPLPAELDSVIETKEFFSLRVRKK